MKDVECSSGLDPASRNRLNRRTAERFAGSTLFERLARTVCQAECLPRKELYETWEVAKRLRRRVRGGRVFDLAAGHGLLAYALLLLDPTMEGAVCVDARRPESFGRLAGVLEQTWPRLSGRVSYREGELELVAGEIGAGDLVVSVHACGGLTDRVLDVALSAGASVAVLPCCHALGKLDSGGLEGWVAPDLGIDLMRAERLRRAGYCVWTGRIPAKITNKNRLLLGISEDRVDR